MNCPHCSAVVAAGTRFCPNCGQLVEAAPQQVSCPACQAPVRAGSRFCPSCGQAMTAAPSQPQPAFVPPPPAAAVPQPPRRRGRCGLCLIGCLVIFLLGAGAAAGLGWWYWDDLSKELGLGGGGAGRTGVKLSEGDRDPADELDRGTEDAEAGGREAKPRQTGWVLEKTEVQAASRAVLGPPPGWSLKHEIKGSGGWVEQRLDRPKPPAKPQSMKARFTWSEPAANPRPGDKLKIEIGAEIVSSEGADAPRSGETSLELCVGGAYPDSLAEVEASSAAPDRKGPSKKTVEWTIPHPKAAGGELRIEYVVRTSHYVVVRTARYRWAGE